VRIREADGRKHAFCSQGCEHLYALEPHRYTSAYTWFEQYDGYDLERYARECHLVRADGKTLVPQPSLRWDKMWTLDDIKRTKIEIQDPLKNLPADGAPRQMTPVTLQ
jgi:hypothetical protein